MLDTCTLAVFGLMNKAPAIWGLDRPAASSSRISRSRSVSPNRASGSSAAGRTASAVRLVQAQPGPPGQGGGFRRDGRRADPAGQGVGLADATAGGLPVTRRRGRLGQP